MKKGGFPKSTSGILSSPVLWAENSQQSPDVVKVTALPVPLPPHFIGSASFLPCLPAFLLSLTPGVSQFSVLGLGFIHPTYSVPGSAVKVKVTQSCLTLCIPMDYTVHGILQARILEWVAFPFSRGSSQPRDQTQVSYIACGCFSS